MLHSRELRPGTMVAGDWRIERMLGQGGFGVTYEARHRSSGAHVALKEYMPSGLCTRIEGTTKVTPAQGPAGDVFKRGLAGFMKEAETLARLDHPSIVRVAGVFEANGTAYMALAYETGGTFSDWLKRLGRPPTQDELDRLLWQLTDALREVHALFMLHRDIKPDNIMLRPAAGPSGRGPEGMGHPKGQHTIFDGTPVLIDFGAVKTVVSSETRTIGGPGTLNLVTDGYAPPEQYVPDGENLLGPWSDVYALGATVYEVITGTRPPVAPRRLIDESYRPLANVPKDRIGAGWRPQFLDGIDKALSLKRSDRPQSMVEFRRALGLAAPAAPPLVLAAGAIDPGQGQELGPMRPPANPSTVEGNSAPASPSPRADTDARIASPAHAVSFTDLPSPTAPVSKAGSPAGKGLAAALGLALLAGGAFATRDRWFPAPEPPRADAPKVAAEAEQQRRRDPIAALVPGSGHSARDRQADGSECSFCPEMVVVPAGRFTMGSPANEKERSNYEGPTRTVTIRRPFAVGKYEVTFAEWEACVAGGGCKSNRNPGDKGWGRGQRPVINVSWSDAKEYVTWLSATTKRPYRLLTEAEWEYAARAGTTTRYSFGDEFSNASANNDKGRTVEVGQYAANRFGLHDMHGNVYEWVEDCWHDNYQGAPTDGSAWTSACSDAGRRVVRGGSWGGYPLSLRSACRIGVATVVRGDDLGFRVARTLNP